MSSLSSKVGVHYPFDVKSLDLEKQLRKPGYSVIARIDIYALLKCLLPRLLDSFDVKWIQSTHYLPKVGHNSVNCSRNDIT